MTDKLSRAATTQAGETKPDFQMVYAEMMRMLNDMDNETFDRQLRQFRELRYGLDAVSGEKDRFGRDLIELIMQQCETDLAAAHEEICKLQGIDPTKYTWPEWSSPANTLRWFNEIREQRSNRLVAPSQNRAREIARERKA